MSAHTVAPTVEHLQRAYAQLAKPDWPSLQALAEAARHHGMVRARAVALANGQTLPAEPTAAAAALPARSAAALSPARRRTDAFDARAAAAGEYVHHLADHLTDDTTGATP